MYVPLQKIIHNAILRYRKIFIVSRTFHVYSQECSVKRQKLRFYLQINLRVNLRKFVFIDRLSYFSNGNELIRLSLKTKGT